MWLSVKGKGSGLVHGEAAFCFLSWKSVWPCSSLYGGWRMEALPVISSRWEHESQSGPVHLFFVLVLSLLRFPHPLPPRERWWLAGVTEPRAGSWCLTGWHGSQAWRRRFILVMLAGFRVGMGGQPHLDTSPKTW